MKKHSMQMGPSGFGTTHGASFGKGKKPTFKKGVNKVATDSHGMSGYRGGDVGGSHGKGMCKGCGKPADRCICK